MKENKCIICADCPRCKPKDTLRNGVKWGICGMGGNIVYLEPWKEKRIHGSGYIHHGASSCGLYKSVEDAFKRMQEVFK